MGAYIESKLFLQNIGWEDKYRMHDSDGERDWNEGKKQDQLFP